MSQPNIHALLETIGIVISKAMISRIITDDAAQFHSEKQEIVTAGFQSTCYQHIDDTSARVNGVNHYNHILCNPYYTAYFTRRHKDRLTILELLHPVQDDMRYLLDQSTLELLTHIYALSEKQLQRLQPLISAKLMQRLEIETLLDELYPVSGGQLTNRRRILEATALMTFLQRDPLLFILICDDAPQFKGILSDLMLCWIHEGRHYKRLSPFLKLHQAQQERVLGEFWDYYRELLSYKEAPSETESERLSNRFDELFTQTTGDAPLDDRLRKTAAKKSNLLLVLKYPELPLHNNSAELAARAQARKRDVSFQTQNAKGTEAKDTMMTIAQIAKKLGVNLFDYIYDRLSSAKNLPSLAEIIRLKASSVLDST
ncbi:hypothetical protein D5085_10325 [Ectothiorhodospiraceae bacterium BW-2]|nr:hypothetical protein D5085_10325 [Ectothiorhodospiraceae bacterium BW-2]